MEAESMIEGQETERDGQRKKVIGREEGGGVSKSFQLSFCDFLFCLKGKTQALRRAQGP